MQFSPLSQLLLSEKRHSSPVFLYQNNQISFAEFYSSVRSLSAFLEQSPKIKWALYCDDTFLFAIGFFALLAAKKTIVLPHNIQAKTLENIDAEGFLFEVDILPHQQNPSQIDCDLDAIALDVKIIFSTSGSTGEPKLIEKNLRNLEEEVKDLSKLFGDNFTGKTIASTVSHQHIYGLLFRLLLPLCNGNLIDSTITTAIEELENLSLNYQNITLISSPAFLKRLPQKNHIADFQIFSSGGLLKKEDAQNCSEAFGNYPIEILGSTETGGVAWRTQKESEVWEKFSQVKIKIDDQNCLWVKSTYAYADDFVAMGDTADLLDEERFILQARIDRIVKIEEKRIALNEIENTLLKHSFVSNCYAVILDGARQMIGVVLELNPSGKTFLQEHNKAELNLLLRTHLLQYFEAVVIPRKWRYVENIPINSQGKILPSDIKKLFFNENSDH